MAIESNSVLRVATSSTHPIQEGIDDGAWAFDITRPILKSYCTLGNIHFRLFLRVRHKAVHLCRLATLVGLLVY